MNDIRYVKFSFKKPENFYMYNKLPMPFPSPKSTPNLLEGDENSAISEESKDYINNQPKPQLSPRDPNRLKQFMFNNNEGSIDRKPFNIQPNESTSFIKKTSPSNLKAYNNDSFKDVKPPQPVKVKDIKADTFGRNDGILSKYMNEEERRQSQHNIDDFSTFKGNHNIMAEVKPNQPETMKPIKEVDNKDEINEYLSIIKNLERGKEDLNNKLQSALEENKHLSLNQKGFNDGGDR